METTLPINWAEPSDNKVGSMMLNSVTYTSYFISWGGRILRSINSPKLPLTFAARLAKKAEVRAIFLLASEETSLHNIEDLIDTAEYSLSLLRKGEILKYIQ
ncbi:hypothetical protein RGQ29_033156 [Quercus rubra]|uniref:LYR motif containing domain-containing protein n=1 Tax=Quercus rubra TaxID=3512 RepID=A0AAN7DTX9_QUERU|nr:hypothetical protein RGQ29_033156 [Quercus rubra]